MSREPKMITCRPGKHALRGYSEVWSHLIKNPSDIIYTINHTKAMALFCYLSLGDNNDCAKYYETRYHKKFETIDLLNLASDSLTRYIERSRLDGGDEQFLSLIKANSVFIRFIKNPSEQEMLEAFLSADDRIKSEMKKDPKSWNMNGFLEKSSHLLLAVDVGFFDDEKAGD